MPMGPWPSFEACMVDPDLAKKYPDEAARQRVCGAIQKRLDGRALDDARFGDRITLAERYAIVHDCIAAREGVNRRGEFKPWAALTEALPTLDGAPMIYSHPQDEGGIVVEVDASSAAGYAVNVRADEAEKALRYDALLYLAPAEGGQTSPADLERNRRLVAHVQAGGKVDNSGGYYVRERPEAGVYDGTPYRVVQTGIRFGHVAILRPFTPQPGACSVEMGCGMGVDHDDAKCCRERLEAAVQEVQEALRVPRRTALGVLRAVDKP